MFFETFVPGSQTPGKQLKIGAEQGWWLSRAVSWEGRVAVFQSYSAWRDNECLVLNLRYPTKPSQPSKQP